MINPQMKKGLLDVCILSVLQRDLSDYIKLSESTLYPILRRLETAGFLEVYSVEHRGRLRKMYRITDSGTDQIREFLDGWNEIEAIYQYIKEGMGNE